MGLYDDRLSELSEPRRGRRVAQSSDSMRAQSLLFDRSAGWTESKAKAWAQSHGYRYGKVDITDQYVRLRQFDPRGSKVKRTIPFGRGIRAVVAREETSMRTSTVKSPRRRRAKRKTTSKKKATHRRPRRRARKARVEASRPRRRRAKVAKRTHRRRPRRSSLVMEAKRKPRRKVRRRRVSEAWKGDSAGHAKAARKGHRRRRRAKAASPVKRRRRRHKATETVMAPKRRRRRHARRARESVMEAPRRSKRRYHARASRSSNKGMGPGGIAMLIGTAGLGFLFADGLDRMIATYDPSGATKPTDKFVSDGAGTAANALNIAASPSWKRLGAGVGLTAVPAVASMFVSNEYGRGALEGLAVGSGINLLKTLWQNFFMPMLIGKDTSNPALQKSYIARLYPAEVAAHVAMAAQKGADGKTAPGPYPAAGVLSGPAPDVGPFALGGDSPYETAAEALRKKAGVGGDSPYETAAEALRKAAGVGYEPGPPAGPGPGPQAAPHTDPACGCIGNPTVGFSMFLGDTPQE